MKHSEHVMTSRGPGLASCCSDGQEPSISILLRICIFTYEPIAEARQIAGQSDARTLVAGPRLRGTWLNPCRPGLRQGGKAARRASATWAPVRPASVPSYLDISMQTAEAYDAPHGWVPAVGIYGGQQAPTHGGGLGGGFHVWTRGSTLGKTMEHPLKSTDS